MNGDSGVTPPGGTPPSDPVIPATPAVQPTTPLAGDPPATPPTNGDDEPISLAKTKELRRENATLRDRSQTAEARLAALEAAETERQRAAMTELQRAQADAQAATAQAEAMRTALAQAAITQAANKLGMFDASDAAALMAQVKYDANGQPANAEELVRALVAGKPHLVDAKRVGGLTAHPGQGTSNTPGTFTTSQLKDFGFYAANEAAILAAMREHRIVKDD